MAVSHRWGCLGFLGFTSRFDSIAGPGSSVWFEFHCSSSICPRQEARIHHEVQQRLQDVAKNVHIGNGRVKSQRGVPVDIFVSHRVKWPHEYILSGQNMCRISHNQLVPIQWMSGFCRGMREEQNQSAKDYILDYVMNLLDDAQYFSWSSAKTNHIILLYNDGAGKKIGGWSEVEKIDRVRRAHTKRHGNPQAVQNV